MSVMEEDIDKETEIIKKLYLEASKGMLETQNYFLNGIQAGPVTKSYLLTRRGIEVLGEEVIEIPPFIDNVLKFANYPKKKIEVLVVLAKHLQTINESVDKSDDL
jgi:hypothetical protein